MINSTIASSTENKVNAKVELYNGSTLVTTCTCNDRLQDFTVERVGQNNKFFGFGIVHKLTIRLIDLDRDLTITKDNFFKVYLGYDEQFINPYPTFYADVITRDENTNTIKVVAYDILAAANAHIVGEVEVPYTIQQFAAASTTLLGVTSVEFINITDTACLETYYETGANFEGTENYKTALDAIAEVTQTFYYINNQDKLIFKRLDKDGEAALIINKDIYYSLESGEKRVLSKITSATELGDNISSSIAESGVTQYVRNNPFWDLREDRAQLVDNAIAAIGGIEADQFYCDWDGNFLLELGDKINIIAEDNSVLTSYLLNDYIAYDSTLSQLSQWVHTNEEETSSNPTTLGEVLKQTYAKVNKQNKTIELLASDVGKNTEDIAALTITTDNIAASVTSLENDLESANQNISRLELTSNQISASVSLLETNINNRFENVDTNYEELRQEVNTKVTATDVTIAIEEERRKGAEKVTTSTGFTFDSEGLTITKSDSEMSTNINEDGLSVFKNGEEVLTADNTGVKATNLHATTYLIIGKNTYFADFTDENGVSRAGCFWTGL